MIEWLRDWLRGYSDADLASVLGKMKAETRPGAIVPVTAGEMKALNEYQRRRWEESNGN